MVDGYGVQASVSGELSLAKVQVNGSFAIDVCPTTFIDSKVHFVDVTIGPTVALQVKGGLYGGKSLNVEVYGSGEFYLRLNAALGASLYAYGGHGSVDLTGTLTGNMGVDFSAGAKIHLWSYFSQDYNFGDFHWTLWNASNGWKDESLGTLYKW
jgi:hypothetical protein